MKTWITSDEDGGINLHFKEQPEKFIGKYVSYWTNWAYGRIPIQKEELPEGCNPKWTDDEPIEVILKIKLKK